MTQIAACLTAEFVALAADRRLVNLASGEPVDDERSKLVVVGRQMAFAYAGLAHIRPPPKGQTDLWLLAQFSPIPGRLPDFFTVLEAAANGAFSRIAHLGPRAKRHVFVAAGWQNTGLDQFEPFVATCSNALSLGGRWELKARPSFRTVYTDLAGHDLRMMAFGQPWGEATKAWLRDETRERLPTPEEGVALTVGAIRRTASENSAVGRGIHAVVLPRKTVSAVGGFQLHTAHRLIDVADDLAIPPVNEPAAIYVPSESNTGELYAPHYIDRHMQLTATAYPRVLSEDEIKKMHAEGLRLRREAG